MTLPLSVATERRILFTLIALLTVIVTANVALAGDGPGAPTIPVLVASPPGDTPPSELAWGLAFAMVFLTLVVETIRFAVPKLRRQKDAAGKKVPLPDWGPLLIVGLVFVGGQILALGGITLPIFPGVVGANVTGLLTSMLAILFNETIWRWTRKAITALLEALWRRLFGEPSQPRKGFARLGLVAAVLVSSLVVAGVAHAIVGATVVTKLALAATTATKCPAAGLANRDAITIRNKDTASIYIGPDNTVTNLTGWEVEAGEEIRLTLGFNAGSTVDAPYVWCYSVAGTASAQTIWTIETRKGTL